MATQMNQRTPRVKARAATVSRKPKPLAALTMKRRAKTKDVAARQNPRLSDLLGIRARLGMTREPFARMAAASVRSLASLEAGKSPSAALARKLVEIDRVCAALSEVMDSQLVGLWLQEPNEAFDGLKPLEVIERGEIDRLWQMIYLLRSGDPA